ncbi:hypothetical protein Nepgr_010723 [Nepenthes gracilis]|uniref:RWP-RK domain-containing protein n=1 Tax=Nepenthes gracilis TaxID=150966 RepID=A0AAD3SCX2_NEPGR|nr:hypothetical protein Nepgr_010723 [Nepenthes gracilis]
MTLFSIAFSLQISQSVKMEPNQLGFSTMVDMNPFQLDWLIEEQLQRSLDYTSLLIPDVGPDQLPQNSLMDYSSYELNNQIIANGFDDVDLYAYHRWLDGLDVPLFSIDDKSWANINNNNQLMNNLPLIDIYRGTNVINNNPNPMMADRFCSGDTIVGAGDALIMSGVKSLSLDDHESKHGVTVTERFRKQMTAGKTKMECLEYEEIQRHFEMPISKAAKQLNVGLTVLKKRCRELNIRRWPHRKIKSLKSLIRNVKELGLMNEVAMLEEHRRMLQRLPQMELTERTKKLRQACFKANYKKRRRLKTRASVSRLKGNQISSWSHVLNLSEAAEFSASSPLSLFTY